MRIKNYLTANLPIFLVLVDPEKCGTDTEVVATVEKLSQIKMDAILIGGSSNLNPQSINNLFITFRRYFDIPLISFVMQSSEVTSLADAVLAPMVLNSRKTWFSFDNFANCIDNVIENNVELITLAYIVKPGATTISTLTDPYEIFSNPTMIRKFARFINSMKFDFAYLEGGSGSSETVPVEAIRNFKVLLDVPLLSGGGIKNPLDADSLLESGADGLIIGTLLETNKVDIVKTISVRIKDKNESH